MVNGTVQQIENRAYLINLGRTESILTYHDQIPGEKFELNLRRNSIEDAGIGKAIYINGTGRYIDFVDKTCTYAVNYLNSKVGFYKQICKN